MNEYQDGTPRHLTASERPVSTLSEDISMADVYENSGSGRRDAPIVFEEIVNK